jgi:acetylornithine deacetylase/succinyl-diaminopimelate desuccinylase-like protein
VPGEAWLTIDWRSIPGELESEIVSRLQAVADACLIEGATATISVPGQVRTCFTGFSMDISACNTPFITRSDDPVLQAAVKSLHPILGSSTKVGLWDFSTDGGHFDRAGATCIGFAPGDEGLAHTVDEHIPIAQIETALAAYEILAKDWASNIDAGLHI